MRYKGHDIEYSNYACKYHVYRYGMTVFESSTIDAAKAAVDLYQRSGSYGYYRVCG